MQAIKGMWSKFTGFLEGGLEEEDWEPEQERVIGGYEDPDEQEYDEHLELGIIPDRSKKKRSNVLEFSAAQSEKEGPSVRICYPKVMEDATLISQHLKEGAICVINMQNLDHVIGQRIADYIGGICYALNGHAERLDNYMFLVAPDGVKIDNGLKEDLKSGGWFKKTKQ